jgi:hypothetical protein
LKKGKVGDAGFYESDDRVANMYKIEYAHEGQWMAS